MPASRFFVPLVRTDGKTYEDGGFLSLEKLLALRPLSPKLKNSLAARTERWLKLKGGLYFYAGHACASFGDIVFVFDADLTRNRAGDASAFDTGGLSAGFVLHGMPAAERVRREWAQRNTFSLREWRVRLQRFVRAHFRASSGVPMTAAWQRYLQGQRASYDDVERRLLHTDNERRAWTFEVRLKDDLDLSDSNVRRHVRLIALTERRRNDLLDAMLAAPAAVTMTTVPVWRTWLTNGTVAVYPDDALHAGVEQWILQRAKKGNW